MCDPIYMPFPAAADIPYVHKPGLANARARGLAVINTDSLGLRAKISGATYGGRANDEYRIALVGDSVTFGEGVEKTEDTYPEVMEAALNQKQRVAKVRVFNFAASAYSVAVMSATLERRMLDVNPDLVLMAIIPNDFNLWRTPAVDAAGNLSADYPTGPLSRNSRIKPVLRQIHLLYIIKNVVYPYFDKREKAEELLAQGRLPDSYAYIKKFGSIAEQHQLAYRIVLLPSLSQFGKLDDQFQRDGISSIDLTGLRNEFTREQFRASRWDPHPSALAHKRIGESLAEYILANNLIKKR